MGSVTVSPDSTVNLTGGYVVFGGGTDADLNVRDNSLSTGISLQDNGSAYGTALLGFANPSLPGGNIKMTQVYVDAATSANLVPGQPTPRLTAFLNQVTNGEIVSSSTLVTWTVPIWIRLITWNGSATLTNNLTVSLSAPTNRPTISTALIQELRVTFVYVAQPTVSVTAPTEEPVTTTRPLIAWLPTLDGDGGDQTAWQVRVFTDAQYGALGFDPEMSTAYASASGTGSTSSWTPPPLPDDTYRAYVRIGQTVLGTTYWSAFDFEQFALVAVKPAAPDVDVWPLDEDGAIQIDIDDQATSPNTDYMEVERAPSGAPAGSDLWEPVRVLSGTNGVLDPGDATIFDFEAPIGVPLQYRVRAVNTTDSDPIVLYGDWTVSGSVTWQSERWWLKHPTRPELNVSVMPQSQASITRASRQGTFLPLGRRNAIVVKDVRSSGSGTLQFWLDDEIEQALLDKLLDAESPVLVQGVPGHHWTDRWVTFGDLDRARIVDKAWVASTFDTLPWTEVDVPTGAVSAWPDIGS